MSRDVTQCQLSGQCSQCGQGPPRRLWPTTCPAKDPGWYCLACWTEFTGMAPRPNSPSRELLMKISGGNAPFYQQGGQPSNADEVAFYSEEVTRLLHPRGVHRAVMEATADCAYLSSKFNPTLAQELTAFLSKAPPILHSLIAKFDPSSPSLDLPKWFQDQVEYVYKHAARETEWSRKSAEAIAALDTPLRKQTPTQRAGCYGGLSIVSEWLRATGGAFRVGDGGREGHHGEEDDTTTTTPSSFDLGDGFSASWRRICEAPPVNSGLRSMVVRVTTKGEREILSLGDGALASVPEFEAFLKAFVAARRDQITLCPVFRAAVKFDLWVTQTLTRLGIFDAVAKRTEATATLGRRVNASGKEMETASLSDETVEMLTECERAVIAHAKAVTPRGDACGTLLWPSDTEHDSSCEWFLQCRRAVRDGNMEAFKAHCKEVGQPFWAILRNVKWTKSPGVSGEFDGLVVDLCNNAVISVVEIKNCPVELPTSRQQREKFVKGLLPSVPSAKAKSITFSGDALAQLLTEASFSDFVENPVLRWLHVSFSEIAPWKSSVRGGISWFIVQELGTLLGTYGYSSTGSAREQLAGIRQALSRDNMFAFRKKMFGIWKHRFEAKEGMVEPLYWVNECVRLGAWNVVLLKLDESLLSAQQ